MKEDPIKALDSLCRLVSSLERSVDEPLFGSNFKKVRDKTLWQVVQLMQMTDYITDAELTIYLVDPNETIRYHARAELNRRNHIRD